MLLFCSLPLVCTSLLSLNLIPNPPAPSSPLLVGTRPVQLTARGHTVCMGWPWRAVVAPLAWLAVELHLAVLLAAVVCHALPSPITPLTGTGRVTNPGGRRPAYSRTLPHESAQSAGGASVDGVGIRVLCLSDLVSLRLVGHGEQHFGDFIDVSVHHLDIALENMLWDRTRNEVIS